MFKTLSMMTLLGLLTISAAHAQSSDTLRADVPFAFQVQHKTFAAGTYQFAYNLGNQVLSVRSVDQPAQGGFALISSLRQSHSDGNKLVFDCQANTCYLSEVWQGGAYGGAILELPKSEASRRVSFLTRTMPVSIPAK